MGPEVSVIVPIYNAEIYIKKCVDSIISQLFNNIEIILVNDGSTDKSGLICDEYAKKDIRIKVIHKNNEGVAMARNEGMKLATGKYFVFIDSDDYVENDYIEILYNAMVVKDVDLVLSGYKKVALENNKIIDEYVKLDRLMSTEQFLNHIHEYLEKMLIQGPCSKIFKRNIIEENNIKFPNNMSFGEDTIFVYSYIEKCKNIFNICHAPYNYLVHKNNSLSSKAIGNKLEIFIFINEKLMNLLSKYNAINEKNKEYINSNICNQLIYLDEDFVSGENIDKLRRLNEVVNNNVVINSFINSKRTDFQYKIIKSLMLRKKIRYINLFYNVKKHIKHKVIYKINR